MGETEWLTVYDPTPDEKGTFNPMLAALHQYVVANLDSCGSPEADETAVQTRIEQFAEVVDLSDIDDETPERSEKILKKLRGARALCEGALMHLKVGGGSRLI